MSLSKYLLSALLISSLIIGCHKNNSDTPPPTPTVPQITTTNIFDLTSTRAASGGNIISNGGSPITVSGICFSKTRMQPSITDDTLQFPATDGAFFLSMKNLIPATTYYVRAFATNSVGTGYGNVLSFTTLALTNTPPEARNVNIFGTIKVAEPIVARYTYFDAENDIESPPNVSFQWYTATDANGTGATAIGNATTDSNFTLRVTERTKYIQVRITPRALTGNSIGVEGRSAWIGPVGDPEPTTITFTYNGQPVTYGIITSALTHRKWLDRNLGAANAATSTTDFTSKGDLFQWGRKADGHQLINRGATTPATTPVNGTTTVLATTENVGHSLFITTVTDPFDWITPQNTNLWTTAGGVNNVCPTGWHVPSRSEWEAEQLTTPQEAFNKLKLVPGGRRNFNDGAIAATTTIGEYWTTTFSCGSTCSPFEFFFNTAGGIGFSVIDAANGYSVRCIKD